MKQALIANGVSGDVHAPAMLRFGFAQLSLRLPARGAPWPRLREVMASRVCATPEALQRKALT